MPLPGHKTSRTSVAESAAGLVLLPSLLRFVAAAFVTPVLSVLFLKCFSHPWEKLQKSPAASTAPVLLHRDQNH